VFTTSHAASTITSPIPVFVKILFASFFALSLPPDVSNLYPANTKEIAARGIAITIMKFIKFFARVINVLKSQGGSGGFAD
jgi:hypothetical protein